ncbi:MAG: mevalonate kinase [Verrucomicrobiota bacterium]
MILTETSWAGIGLAGNPSDGCYGKALAVPAANYSAEVTLYESPEINLVPTLQDHSTFSDLDEMSEDVETFGYYGGVRLLKAAARIFLEHCQENGIALPDRNFTARYSSSIPRRVGLAESSAVVTAMLKALVRFYQVPVEQEQLPRLAWITEREELGIPCGLMDRVMQTYGEPVFMDLNHEDIQREGHGTYQLIPRDLIPPLVLALPDTPRPTGQDYHRTLGIHAQEGNGELIESMDKFANFAVLARDALLAGDLDTLGAVMDQNFDLRRSLFPVPETETAVVQALRKLGIPAKLAGGSGTVVGLCRHEKSLESMAASLQPHGYCAQFLALPEPY